MHAQHQIQESGSQHAQAARSLLQANLAYGESNSGELSHIKRLQARQECRNYLAEALNLEPNNAGALGLLGRVVDAVQESETRMIDKKAQVVTYEFKLHR